MATLTPRHDHDGMDMGSMGTSSGVPGYFYLQKMFWVVIGSAIGVAAVCNLLNTLLLWERSRSSSAKPRSLFWTSFATITAMAREISNASFGSYQFGPLKIRSPTLGKIMAVMSYFITILVFCFYRYNTFDQWSWEEIAYRVGCIAQAQLPLVFLLAGKQNIIGFLVGSSYESLNWLHRWVARILWVTVTIHMSFWFRSWARYNYIKVKLATDSMTQTGFAAWCILTAIVLTSFYPVRRWNYEVFVVQHLILFAGLIGAIMIHVDYGPEYVWISVALYFFDRLVRFTVAVMANLTIFRRGGSGLWANKATFTRLPGNVTRISIDRPVISWKPGQHMFLSCHSVVPLQSHPFTAATLPADGRLEFLVQAHNGGTKRFHHHASKYQRLTDTDDQMSTQLKYVGIEGPYGNMRPLQQFDSLIFFAGSTGATFTVPLMRDILRRWKQSDSGQRQIVTRAMRFVWVIKSRDRLTWFREQLEQAMSDIASLQGEQYTSELELSISVYVTCDEELNASDSEAVCTPQDRGGILDVAPIESNNRYERKSMTEGSIEVTASDPAGLKNVGCAPDGGCCCKAAVEDDNAAPVCCCCKPVSSSSNASTNEKSDLTLSDSQTHEESLHILSGRPKPKSIIRKVLEEAQGESAVIVCGPQGLQDDVRHSVVSLSDERAVHKGTGAQGIYLHVEGFGY